MKEHEMNMKIISTRMNSRLEINFGEYFPFEGAKQIKLFWIFEVLQKTDFPRVHRYQPNLCIHKTI